MSPSLFRGCLARLRGLLRAEQPTELDAEILEHVRLLTERYVRLRHDARRRLATARRQFGNTAMLREDHRQLQTFVALENIARDLAATC